MCNDPRLNMQNVQAVLESIDFDGMDAGRARSAAYEAAWRLGLTLADEELELVIARILERLGD